MGKLVLVVSCGLHVQGNAACGYPCRVVKHYFLVYDRVCVVSQLF
jgi:hypothetical protein